MTNFPHELNQFNRLHSDCPHYADGSDGTPAPEPMPQMTRDEYLVARLELLRRQLGVSPSEWAITCGRWAIVTSWEEREINDR